LLGVLGHAFPASVKAIMKEKVLDWIDVAATLAIVLIGVMAFYDAVAVLFAPILREIQNVPEHPWKLAAIISFFACVAWVKFRKIKPSGIHKSEE
jgi:hypothetical protein